MKKQLTAPVFVAALAAGIVLLLIAGLYTGQRAYAASPWVVQVMPSNSAGGSQAGLHFNDGGRAARDFAHGNSAWIRGWLLSPGSHSYTFRFQYWAEGSCRTRARLQRLDGGVWYDDYNVTVDILHLNDLPSGSQYTQEVDTSGEWFYKTVGTASTCGTPGAHSHLAAVLSYYITYSNGVSSDTCWANGMECYNVFYPNPRKHFNNNYAPFAECPGYWDGSTYASSGSPDYKRSGGTGTSPDYSPYACQSWSAMSWGSDSSVYNGSGGY